MDGRMLLLLDRVCSSSEIKSCIGGYVFVCFSRQLMVREKGRIFIILLHNNNMVTFCDEKKFLSGSYCSKKKNQDPSPDGEVVGRNTFFTKVCRKLHHLLCPIQLVIADLVQ